MSTPTSTTVSSGETLDPNAARRFVGEVEDVARQLLSQVELSLSSLQGSGVAGEPLTHLAGIQEALGGVVSQAHAAASHFDRHIGTQDQVTSDPSLAGTVNGSYLGRG